MFTVNVYSSRFDEKGATSLGRKTFDTKREALDYIRSMQVSFIKKIEKTYTVYAK